METDGEERARGAENFGDGGSKGLLEGEDRGEVAGLDCNMVGVAFDVVNVASTGSFPDDRDRVCSSDAPAFWSGSEDSGWESGKCLILYVRNGDERILVGFHDNHVVVAIRIQSKPRLTSESGARDFEVYTRSQCTESLQIGDESVRDGVGRRG